MIRFTADLALPRRAPELFNPPQGPQLPELSPPRVLTACASCGQFPGRVPIPYGVGSVIDIYWVCDSCAPQVS